MWNFMKRGATSGRSSGRSATSVVSTMRPVPERIVRISKTLSCLPSARIASALTENERSAPVIHAATRPMFWLATTIYSASG